MSGGWPGDGLYQEGIADRDRAWTAAAEKATPKVECECCIQGTPGQVPDWERIRPTWQADGSHLATCGKCNGTGRVPAFPPPKTPDELAAWAEALMEHGRGG